MILACRGHTKYRPGEIPSRSDKPLAATAAAEATPAPPPARCSLLALCCLLVAVCCLTRPCYLASGAPSFPASTSSLSASERPLHVGNKHVRAGRQTHPRTYTLYTDTLAQCHTHTRAREHTHPLAVHFQIHLDGPPPRTQPRMY